MDNPPRVSGRAWGVLGAIGLGAVILLGARFGYLRAALAVGMFGALVVFMGRYIVNMAQPPPPEQQPVDASAYDLRYVCSNCGLELKVEMAAREKPPTHCMEPMVLVRASGSVP